MRWRIPVLLLLFLFNNRTGYTQTDNLFLPDDIVYSISDTTAALNDPEEVYEEILLTLNVQRIGSLEIPAIIFGQKVYLSVTDIFDFLKIRNTPSADFDSVSGFFINPKSIYLIDHSRHKISFEGKLFILRPNDILKTATGIYLRSEYFGQIFGLVCMFDFRSLSVNLNTKTELPAIREMQQKLMRRNLSLLTGEKKADTIINRSFTAFHVGMVDWSVMSSQETKGRKNTRAILGIGAVVAGGELNLLLNYNSDEKINLRQQNYQWRFVNNSNPLMRQIAAGKIFAQSTSSVFAPVIGFQLTNTPTTYRKSFGTYTISNTTEPEWVVELYVNNVLVNYTKADASGFYRFEVPMVYGNSVVKLRFYGPWGEERTSEQYISVPFNFVRLHQLEYTVTGGMVEDGHKSMFARASLSYGLSRRITIGGGMEYLSSVTSGKYMPFINASARVGSHTLVSVDHTYGVRSKAVLNYRRPSNLQVDVTYIRYAQNQTAIQFNYLEERRIALSMPLRGKKITAFTRFSLNQFTFPEKQIISTVANKKYTTAELLFSTVLAGISSNLTTFAVINNPGNPLVYSNLSFTFRLPKGIRFTPQAQYEYQQHKFSMLRAEVEKNIFKQGFLRVAYERYLLNKNFSSVTVAFRYNFSFAQTFFSANQNKETIATTQSARGSFMIDSKTNYIAAGNQIVVGRGGIVVLPYLDVNNNGLRDMNEPKVFGLNLRINGGRIERNLRDTTIRITGLDAYANYFIELDKNSFDHVAWQLKKQTISVTVEPNNFKVIEVAVTVAGEASGMVSVKDGEKGLGRIIVNFYNSDLILAGRTITEADGYFSFLGLPPGLYTARVDEAQLKKIKMSSSSLSFTILPLRDGDIADGLNFMLHSTADTDQ